MYHPGKGTYLETLRNLLVENSTSTALQYHLTDHPYFDYYVIKHMGKHANICRDVSHKHVENTETLKKLTSNTDYVRGRRVREKPIDFLNYARIIIALNRLSRQTLSRSESGLIKNSGKLSGIVNWALEGLK